MDMDKNNVTPDNSKDEFDDVLEIMKKRRTKPEYSATRPTAGSSDSSSTNVSDISSSANEPKSSATDKEVSTVSNNNENNAQSDKPILTGALSETIIVPVAKATDASSVNNSATVVDMPAAKPKAVPSSTPSNNDATAIHDAVMPAKPKTFAAGDLTTVNTPTVKKEPMKSSSDNPANVTDEADHEAVKPIAPKPNSTSTPADTTAISSEKTVEVSSTKINNNPDATKVNIAAVKPATQKPETKNVSDNTSSGTDGAISLDDFNTTSTNKKINGKNNKVKVTFLGSVWFGIIKIVLYLGFVLAISSALAASVIFIANDIFAFVKESEIVAEIPNNANSSDITSILNQSGIISDASDTILTVNVKKNNTRKLADLLNTTSVIQPLKDAGITKIKINDNNEFEITIPLGSDISVIGELLDTVDATSVKADMQIIVQIPEGATTADVGKILKEAGVIKYSGVFKIYAEYRIDKRSYLTGEYIPGTHALNPMMNYDTILDTLSAYDRNVSGTVRITIPEGLTVKETIDLLVEKGVGKAEDYTEALQSFEYEYKFATELTPDKLSEHRFNTDISYRLEGYLFPDTYDFYYNENPISVLDKFLSNFNRKFEEEYYTRAAALGMTVDEVMILASMIEKEGNNPSDYYIISSVFHNRLNSSEYPYLNSDATLQYALSKRTGLYELDTSMNHPYNTYKNRGLPPGPICNPGIQAIDAALYPESTNYYYFYTKKNGETVYSRTYEEHQRYVNADKQVTE